MSPICAGHGLVMDAATAGLLNIKKIDPEEGILAKLANYLFYINSILRVHRPVAVCYGGRTDRVYLETGAPPSAERRLRQKLSLAGVRFPHPGFFNLINLHKIGGPDVQHGVSAVIFSGRLRGNRPGSRCVGRSDGLYPETSAPLSEKTAFPCSHIPFPILGLSFLLGGRKDNPGAFFA